MKKVVSVSLGPSKRDYEFVAELWGEPFHVRRVGTDGDTAVARRLVREHDGQVDCIALGGMAISFTVAGRTWHHRDTLSIARAARSTPVVGGRALKRIVDRWAIREVARRRPELFDGKNVLFLSGIANWDAVEVMGEFSSSMVFGDPVLHWGVPTVLVGRDALTRYSRAAMPFLTRRPYGSFFPRGRAAEGIQQRELARFFQRADVVVGDLRLLRHYAPKDMSHLTVVTDSIDEDGLGFFRQRGVDVVCATTPSVFPDDRSDLQILHACAIAHLQKAPLDIGEADYLALLADLQARPSVFHPRGQVRKRHKFAYLYYPPARRDLFRDPKVRWMRTLPPEAQALAERAAARLPIQVAAPVRGIVSTQGEEAEGWILVLPATADQIAARGPAFAERRIHEAVRLAQRLGAEILGVGAFGRTMTRAVADVAAAVDLPITSGASFLISADLWAAKQAVLAMGIPQNAVGRAQGTALVVGAGDPQGAVAAELIALVFERVVIVDREPDRLLALVDRIGHSSPHCDVQVSTAVGGHPADCDLVITGLAPGWEGAVDIEGLKPGAVLADFARPAEFGTQESERRPDVLIVYSGELELPGPADLGINLGPPPKTAFGSLAEVAVLALEGRNECFTLGDAVDLDRVKEIYKLGLRHGFQLAGMRGPRGPIAETTIKLVRERADAVLRAADLPPPVDATHLDLQPLDEDL